MRLFAVALLLFASGCTEEPTPAEAEKAMKEVAERDSEADVKAEQKSIEQAADDAAKLVEEEAKEEIDAMRAANTDN